MSFPRYPAYSPVNLEWVREIPSQWTLKRLKNVTRINMGQSPSSEDCNLEAVGCPFLQGNAEFGDRSPTPRMYCSSPKKLASAGDILLSVRAPVGAINVADQDYGIGRGLCAIRPVPGVVREFLVYVLFGCREALISVSNGSTYEAVSAEQVGNLGIPVPPPSEQKSIAAFLNSETAKLDALIAAQERLIELLKEKRQAVISWAVTKGLSRTVKVKSSGVDWMGDIPVHWDLVPMSAIARIVRGASPRPAGDPKYFNGDHIPWITVAEITKDNYMYLDDTESRLTQAGAEHSNYFPEGTLVYSNSGATLGVPKILRIGGCANDGVVAFLDLSDRASPEFLYYYLDSITLHIREKIRQGSGQPNLNTDIVKGLRIGLPSREEQQCIIREIETVVEAHTGLTKQAGQAVDLLRERRSALISAAVTGQIDVRGFAEQKAA